nr:odorant receptor 4 [Phthorimaea operculella]
MKTRKTLDVPSDDNEDVLSCKYVKLLRRYLWLLRLWPGEEFGEKVPFLIKVHGNYVQFQIVLVLVAQLIYIHKYYDTMNFFLKGYTYLLFLLSIVTFFRLFVTTLKSYGTIVKTLFNTLHLANRKLDEKFEKQVYIYVEKISYISTLTLIIMSYIGVSFFNIAPLYLNYKNGYFSGQQKENSTYNCIVCITIPKLTDSHDFSFFSTIFTMYITYPCTISVCGIDILLILMAFQIIGNMLVLRNRLETLSAKKEAITNDIIIDETQEDEQSSFVLFNEEENKLIHVKLVDCIKHHTTIIMFAEMMSSLFGPVLGLNYAFHLAACCLLLLECAGGTDAIFRFGPLTVIIFSQLILLSVVFEIVATVSEKLKNSVYFMPWERMDSRNRRTVYIMLARAQTPIRVNALGLANVGVTTMAQILKMTASYYALLNSISK